MSLHECVFCAYKDIWKYTYTFGNAIELVQESLWVGSKEGGGRKACMLLSWFSAAVLVLVLLLVFCSSIHHSFH